jgi:hypothetical protein
LLKEGKRTLSAVAAGTVGASKSSFDVLPSSLTEKGTLKELLLSGPLAVCRIDLRALKRIAQTIHKHFGIRYHSNRVWRLLRGTGWSFQKQDLRTLQKNDKRLWIGRFTGGPVESLRELKTML